MQFKSSSLIGWKRTQNWIRPSPWRCWTRSQSAWSSSVTLSVLGRSTRRKSSTLSRKKRRKTEMHLCRQIKRMQSTYFHLCLGKRNDNAQFCNLTQISSPFCMFLLLVWLGLSQRGSKLSFVFMRSDSHLTIITLTHWIKTDHALL